MTDKKSITLEYAKLTQVLDPNEFAVFKSFVERYVAYVDPSYVHNATLFLNAEIDAPTFLIAIGKKPTAKMSEGAIITRACYTAARIIRASKTR